MPSGVSQLRFALAVGAGADPAKSTVVKSGNWLMASPVRALGIGCLGRAALAEAASTAKAAGSAGSTAGGASSAFG